VADNSHEDSHKDVQRILLSRFGIDLTEIEYEFNKNFAERKDLKQTILAIKSDKVSDYVNIIKLAEEQLKTQKIKKGGNISI
jgi:ABC-type metal ion transport system substrate-binding protein